VRFAAAPSGTTVAGRAPALPAAKSFVSFRPAGTATGSFAGRMRAAYLALRWARKARWARWVAMAVALA
jgi:hypothetical protein